MGSALNGSASIRRIFLVLMIASLILSACAQATPTPAPAKAPAAAPTTAPKTEAAPAQAPKPAAAAAPTQAAAPKPAASTQDREQALQQLYNAAKAEGQVLFQTALQVSAVQPLIDGFQAKYPGIKVSAFMVNISEMPSRIVTESAAGKLTVDVATGKLNTMFPVLDRDLVVSDYDWRKVSDVDPASIVSNGKLLSLWDSVPTWIYNTKLLTADQAPKSLQDLLDPKWKGRKIAITKNGQFGLFWFRQWEKNKQDVVDFMTKLRAQEMLPGGTALDTAQRVASGEAPIGWTILGQVPIYQAQGAPITVASIGPSIEAPIGFYLPKKSPNPNSAKLLVAWLSSSESKPFWGKTPLLRSDEGDPGRLLKAAGVVYENLTTEQQGREAIALMESTAQTVGTVIKQ